MDSSIEVAMRTSNPAPAETLALPDAVKKLLTGTLALPNLLLRSLGALLLLYGMVSLCLIGVSLLGLMEPLSALLLGVGLAAVQFGLGPYLMDLNLRWWYTMNWVQPEALPSHLQRFLEEACQTQGITFPSIAIIEDGAPQAYTYGHSPKNARIVITRGLLHLLTPAELEAVVAHELGHIRHWDMLLMTAASIVPLVLYFIYRTLLTLSSGKNKESSKASIVALPVALAAFVLYWLSQYIVLWYGRVREYHADRAAAELTGNPNALANALVKVAYGLVTQQSQFQDLDARDDTPAYPMPRPQLAGAGLAAFNIIDQSTGLNVLVSSFSPSLGRKPALENLPLEAVKDAVQWDFWNPWASYYELHSTHPLVAKRLQHLAALALLQGEAPLFVFDRAQPESYWDDFLRDLLVLLLPWFGIVVGLIGGLFLLLLGYAFVNPLGLGLLLLGLALLFKTYCCYPGGDFPSATVADLLAHVKVSPVRPVRATLRGKIVGKGEPGLAYSEDFVLQDVSGLMILDYHQPIPLWNFFFGFFKAEEYQSQEITVTGWFRRSPVPYLEINHLTVTAGDGGRTRCYGYISSLLWAALAIAVGIFLQILPFILAV